LGAVVISSGQLVSAVQTVHGYFYPGPDALALALQTSKESISKDFVENTSRRIYLSRNYLDRLEYRAHGPEIDEGWKNLLASVEEMSTKALTYTVSFAQFYNDARRDEFKTRIEPSFADVTKKLYELRYSSAVKKLELSTQGNVSLTDDETKDIRTRVKDIRGALDALEIQIFHFAVCFDKQSQTETACKPSSSGGSW
jgi:hypothetical protein